MADDQEVATAVVKSEKPEERKRSLFHNDGNFLQNYLNMQKKSEDSTSKNVKKEVKKVVGPPIKKSRFTSMFNQMKKTQVPGMAKIGNAKGQCFRNEDSDSSSGEDDATVKTSQKRDEKVMPNTNTSSLLRGIPMLSAQQYKSQPPSASSTSSSQSNRPNEAPKTKKKRSRWGEKVDLAEVAPPGIAVIPGMPTPQMPIQPVFLPQNYRPPGLVGVTELSDAQRKQLEEQKEMQVMYDLIMSSRNAQANAATQIAAQKNKRKNKHEYDSDEDIDEDLGTWEHQNRRNEMQKTQELAENLTGDSEGKHFIGDFLPPDELKRFMETFKALKEGRTPDLSDYKEFKIQCDNIGFKMLQNMGWSEGEGLGQSKQGITAPVNKGQESIDGRGVGVERPDGLSKDDDEFSAYRKRMMLAYRFRPNPLNNPRRPYY